jgi:hypothetical protein
VKKPTSLGGREGEKLRLGSYRIARQRAARNQIFFLCLNPCSVALGFKMPMSSSRAIRYRRLALAEKDKANADLLLKLADECDRGILCTAEWRSARPSRKNEQPSKAEDAKFRFEWDPLPPLAGDSATARSVEQEVGGSSPPNCTR